MAYKVEFIEKIDKNSKKADGSNDPKRIDNLSTLCCWCYRITKEPSDPWEGAFWGIDLPNTIDVKSPDELNGCTECNKYERIKGEGEINKDKWILLPFPRQVPPVSQNEITICFAAPCGEDPKGSTFSIEYLPSGGKWTKKGDSHVVVSPLASLPGSAEAPAGDQIAAIAHYEGLKLASLLNEVRRTTRPSFERDEALAEISADQPPIEDIT